jgi:hypothetical protein
MGTLIVRGNVPFFAVPGPKFPGALLIRAGRPKVLVIRGYARNPSRPAGIGLSKVPGTLGTPMVLPRPLPDTCYPFRCHPRTRAGSERPPDSGMRSAGEWTGRMREGGPAPESGVSDEISVRGRPTYWPDAKRLLTSRARSRAQGIEWLRRIHR